jgi:hypothetical protein
MDKELTCLGVKGFEGRFALLQLRRHKAFPRHAHHLLKVCLLRLQVWTLVREEDTAGKKLKDFCRRKVFIISYKGREI